MNIYPIKSTAGDYAPEQERFAERRTPDKTREAWALGGAVSARREREREEFLFGGDAGLTDADRERIWAAYLASVKPKKTGTEG